MFESNQAYLFYEMQLLQQRLNSYIALKDDASQLGDYLKLNASLATERLNIIDRRRASVAKGVELPLERIVERFELSPQDEDVLLICLSPHISFTVWNLLIYAQGSVLKAYLEVGFLADMLNPPQDLISERSWCEPSSTLISSGLLYTEPPREGSVSTSILSNSIQAPHYLANAILGNIPLDEQLQSFCTIDPSRVALEDVILTRAAKDKVTSIVQGFFQSELLLNIDTQTWSILLSGPRNSGKTSLSRALATSFKRPLFTIHLDRLPRGAKATSLLKLIGNNARFLNAVLHFIKPEIISPSDPNLFGVFEELLRQHPGIAILETHDNTSLHESLESSLHFTVDLGRPDADIRLNVWRKFLPEEAIENEEINVSNLASTYDLTSGQISAAISWASQLSLTRTPPRLTQEDLIEGAVSQLRTKLDDLTELSTARLTMEHLVLPEEPLKQVNEFLNACRFRHNVMNEWGFARRLVTGRGLVALFTGDPGTGKTLTAEILANELGLRLQIVSIPKIVSKWVGETEKNVRKVFSHAKAQNSMLLFDEADSLFATRVKVERAQDHFQNMEVNNLLQEIERFDGVVILTTNLETNMDDAFQRRILFKIEFPVPKKEQRLAIWKSLIPKQVPLEDEIDFEILAEDFELTGGQIKNAIIRAAYQCYSQNQGFTQDALELSAWQQAVSAGRLAPHLGH